jgi:hypothetical protein
MASVLFWIKKSRNISFSKGGTSYKKKFVLELALIFLYFKQAEMSLFSQDMLPFLWNHNLLYTLSA